MLRTRYDVFLSYSRADSERAIPLRDALRGLGYRVFFDTGSIDPGERWKPRLARGVRGSRALVLCWSEHSRASDYVTFEYSRAESLGKVIFPWLLDKTALPAMLEVNGIVTQDVTQVAAELRRGLGWTLKSRRIMAATVVVALLSSVGAGVRYMLRPPPPIDVAALVDPALEKLLSSEQTDGGTMIGGGPSGKDEQVWTTAQAIRAETDFPKFGESHAARVRQAFGYLKNMRQPAPQAGWGLYYGQPSLTEIDAWVQLAYLQSLRVKGIWSAVEIPEVVSRVQVALQEICDRQMADGGWVPIDDKNEHFTRTYSTLMAIWALTEAQQVEPTRTMALKYDQNLSQGINWLLNHFDAAHGWVPDPMHDPLNRTMYALTAQTYYVLARAAELPQNRRINADGRFIAARHMLLTYNQIANRDITDNDAVSPLDARFRGVRFPGAPQVTDFEMEGSFFVWAPWLLAAYSQIAADASVPVKEQQVARLKSREALQKIQQGRPQIDAGEVYTLAETLICVGEATLQTSGTSSTVRTLP